MIPELLSITILLLTIYIFILKPRARLPGIPGPWTLPIIGSSAHLNPKDSRISMHTLSKKYGPVYQVYFQGSSPSVVVCDYQTIHQVLVAKSADFAGRPTNYINDLHSEGQSGVGRTNARPEVRGRRKLLHGFLKQYGGGMQRIEEITGQATVDMLHRLLDTPQEQPVDISAEIFRCVADVMGVLIMGETFSGDFASDAQTKIRQISVGLGKSSLSSTILNNFPWMRHFGNQAYKDIIVGVEMRNTVIESWLNSRPVAGLIAYLDSLSEAEKAKFHISEHKQQRMTIADFFNAGVVTTSSTLSMLVNVLCQRQDIQSKLRDEILSVIGTSRKPCLADRDQMPFHLATLLEITRYASVVALGIPHKTVRDTTIEIDLPQDNAPSSGEKKVVWIPAGVEVITLLWSLHHDEDFWSDPFSFDPGRFLDPLGHLYPADHPNRQHVMPFGAGQRGCVAEVFAMSRMFLILSHLLQSFRVLPETTSSEQPSADPRDMKYGSIMAPPDFKVRLEQVV